MAHRLSQIQTRWSLVTQAHQEVADAATRAQAALAQRYYAAIYRYILGAVRDANVADDLAQEFALRLVRGSFKSATPERGRFRDFIKTAVYHLIVDHQRRKAPVQFAPDMPEPPEPPKPGGLEECWREELLNRAWDGLAQVEKESGQPFYTLLRYRAENPDVRSARMAEALEGQIGKALTETAVRKALQRARERFSDLLLEEVARSLQSNDRSDVEQELIDLDLLSYCRSALERFGGKQGGAD